MPTSRWSHPGQGTVFSLAVWLVLCARGGLGAEDAANQAARDYNVAAALQNEGLHERAAEKWLAFIGQYPGDSRLDRAHYYLGICQLHVKKYPEAIAAFQTVLGKYPSFSDAAAAQYNLGMARYQAACQSKNRDDFQAAAEALAAAASKYPQGKHAAAALYYQGEALLAAGQAAAAGAAYKKLIADFPAAPLAADAYYALGLIQQDAGQDADAAATFQKFLGTPQWAGHELAGEVRLRLALVLWQQKKYAEAEPHFAALAAVADFPHADLALLRQGQCRLQLGQAAEAAPLLEGWLKKFPNSPYKTEAQLAAGKCWFSIGKLSEAQQAFEPLAKARGRESAEAAYWLARTLLRLGKPQEALTAVEAAISAGHPPSGSAAAETATYLELARGDALAELPNRRKEAAAAYEKFVGQHADHPLAAQALYMAASTALAEKDYAAARKHAEAFAGDPRLAGQPLLPAALCIAAEGNLAPGGDAGKAEQFYRQVAQRFAKSNYSALALYKLGEMSARQKKYDEAVRCYQECLAESPQGEYAAQARSGLAAACFAKEDYAGATTALAALLASNPEPAMAARARYLRGLVLQRQKQVEAAAADLEAFLATQPPAGEAADARYALVLCHIAGKQFDKAAAVLAALVADKADYRDAARAYYELGHALLGDNRAEPAAAAFRTLAEKYPQSPLAAEAWFHVARWNEETADRLTAEDQKTAGFAKAAEGYAAGLAKAKDAELHEKLQYKLAEMKCRGKQFEQAAALLQAQLREHPSGSLAGPARFLAAECLFRQGKFDEALPLFAKVADDKVEKYQAQALYRAGASAAEQKKWPESQKFYEGLLRDFPQFEQLAEARYGLAVAMQSQGRLAEARAIQEQLAKTAEAQTAVKARFMLGEIAFAQHKFEDAVEQYLGVTTGYPFKHWQGLAQFEIGRCFLSLGKRQQAIDAFRTVVEKYPDHPRAQDAGKMLAELK
ncbi:MAG: tetratricopeptide repeat protein [Thermoguttaceae bacterium]